MASILQKTFLLLIPRNLTKICIHFSQHNKAITLEVDAIDDFTSQLLQKKTHKWERKKAKAESIINNNYLKRLQENDKIEGIKEMDNDYLNTVFQNAIDSEKENVLIDLTNQCIELRRCPSFTILLHILSIFSRKGDNKTIIKIEELCKELNPKITKDNSNFDHFLAEAIWVKGNITDSLKIFEKVYRENSLIRRRIRIMIKSLTKHVISNKSEAALVSLIKFSKTMIDDFQDYFPLMCTWESCFLSEWYTDQNRALELLEKNDRLCNVIINRIPYVVHISLRCHRTEVVYRLLEILIRYDMKPQYSAVLMALFDYQFQVGDSRNCLEIIQWASKNEVNLPSIYNEKFIKLLIKNKIQLPTKSANESKKIPTYKF
ncbi:unnamed protein product [Brassicogethes aeneus]|uniref:Uncharacterized protein n=1 Tax=Brassicogethes aeneus TaxID=1431903 RepID=A0A9P0FEF8_BRAAE|nr:unnamed protein product [Brassicogethes aeneus]